MQQPRFHRLGALLLVLLMLLTCLPLQVAYADNYGSASGEVKRQLGIYFVDSEGVASQGFCANAVQTTPTAPSSTPTAFNPDPAALQIFNTTMKPRIEQLAPLYQKAAQAEGLHDWELLPSLHYLEYGLLKTNPTNNTAFKSPFQMSGQTLQSVGIDTSAAIFTPGKDLTDDEFVTVARYAIRVFIKGKAQAFNIDVSKPLDATSAAKIIAAYKSGEGSVWFTGKADFNLHAYAWAGYDTTPAHKLPMHWGPGSPYGDEQSNQSFDRPGAATTFGILKGGSYDFACGDGAGGAYTPPQYGSIDELRSKILNHANIKFGNYGPASSQKQDVADCLTEKTLSAFLAMADQSGVKILVNALARDHGGCTGASGSYHNSGRAIDIGYYGSVDSKHNADGDKLFSYLYRNYKSLGLAELIWKYPPAGMKCIGQNGPTDCDAYYGQATMDLHASHIHVGIN